MMIVDDRRRIFLDAAWQKIRDRLTPEEVAFFKRTDYSVKFTEEERVFISVMISKYSPPVDY